nr:hypothetical protein [Tanacetum cinerariifolium]
MLIEQDIEEGGDAEEHVQDVIDDDVAQGDDTAAYGEVPTVFQEPSIPSPTLPNPPPQPPQYLPSTSQGRIIDKMDKDDDVALMDDKEEYKKEEEAKVVEDDQEDELAEVHEVVDVVTTAKLITEVNMLSFSGRAVPLFDSMQVHQGESSGTLTEPHHTPSPEAQQSPQHDLSSSILPSVTTAIIPIVIPTEIPTLRQYSRRSRIAQYLALPTAADEPASPLRDDSQGEACLTVSGLEAGHDRANIIKTSALSHDSTPRVTSLAADEGSMQHQLTELTDLYTRLQRQQTDIATKIAAHDLEISNLKARIKMLEDKDAKDAKPSGEDATIKGRSLEIGEEVGVERNTKRGSNDTEELVNVLTSLDAVSIITSRVQVASVPLLQKLPLEDQRRSEQIARDAETARIHAEEELHMLIDGLDKNNETIAKEDLTQLWTLVRETLSIRQAASDKKKELW